MESSKLGYWLQVGANVGILLGLVFVGLQLQQDRELKSLEMVSRSVTDLVERELAAMGDGTVSSYRESSDEPRRAY